MRQVLVNDIERCIELLNGFSNSYIYRGHADSAWALESSLERVIGTAWCASEARRFEDFSLGEFQAKFHLYDAANIPPTSKLAWLAIMQHYGVPTRLLDFTESPYVALYFALEAYQPRYGRDLALFAIDYSALMDRSIDVINAHDSTFNETRMSIYPKQDRVFDETVDRFSYNLAWVTEPRRHNVRVDRQAGTFLVSGNLDHRISDVLEMPIYSAVDQVKLTIPKALYPQLFALLRKTNVTSKSLYGDLDGLARAIRMQMQVYSAPSAP